MQITEDGRAVVTHDRQTNPVVCRDTGPAMPGDTEFPYVGKLVKNLTVTQLSMLDCGTRRPLDPRDDPVVDTQIPVPGARIVQLDEVFALVHKVGAGGDHGVRLNVETKVEAGAPGETAPREQFVQVTVDAVRRAGLIGNVSIQSFDWGALKRVREIEPRLAIVALVDPTTAPNRPARRVTVAGRHRHRRLRGRSGPRGEVVRRRHHLPHARRTTDRVGARRGVPAVHHRRDGRRGTCGRDARDPVDG